MFTKGVKISQLSLSLGNTDISSCGRVLFQRLTGLSFHYVSPASTIALRMSSIEKQARVLCDVHLSQKLLRY